MGAAKYVLSAGYCAAVRLVMFDTEIVHLFETAKK